MPVAVAKQLRGDRVPVGSRTLEHFAQTAKVTEHAPRGRDTSRNSLVPLGASESPRSALSPAVSVPRYHAPTTRAWQAGSLARKWSLATSHDRLGFLAVPRLWGLPDSPQAQAVGFPTHTHRYSESPYGSSPARFPASICSAAWDRLPTSRRTLERVKRARPAHMPFDLCFRGDRKSDKTDHRAPVSWTL